MSIPTINPTAAQAREQARHTDGRFGEQHKQDPGQLDLGHQPTTPPDTFEWVRIESLIGHDFHLDPNRTATMPRINPDDDVAQMTSKLTNYVARTQNLDDLTDTEIAAMAGYKHAENTEMSPQLRRNWDVPDTERIIVAHGQHHNEEYVYLSTNSTFKRTGSFRPRYGGGRPYGIQNVAQVAVTRRFEEEFAELHPEFDRDEVRHMFRRLGDKSYRGKKWKHVWDESYASPALQRLVAPHVGLAELEKDSGSDPEVVARKIRDMRPEELQAVLDRLPTETRTVWRPGSGETAVEYYVVSYGPIRLSMRVDDAHADVAGTSDHAKLAAMNRAYREFLVEKLAVEYDYTLQRKYVRDHTDTQSATVFEQKKHVPESHVKAAQGSFFKASGDFGHVEIDEDVDLARFGQVEREYEQLRRFLPRTARLPKVRFRKTGRHKARGVYHPHAANLAVDPRHPDSFVHEYLHHVDHTAGGRNLSSGEEFRPILREAQSRLAVCDAPTVRGKLAYYQTPTEVHSRTGELYFYWKGVGGSLNGDSSKYETDPAYTTLAPMREQIVAFWDGQLAELGAEVPG